MSRSLAQFLDLVLQLILQSSMFHPLLSSNGARGREYLQVFLLYMAGKCKCASFYTFLVRLGKKPVIIRKVRGPFRSDLNCYKSNPTLMETDPCGYVILYALKQCYFTQEAVCICLAQPITIRTALHPKSTIGKYWPLGYQGIRRFRLNQDKLDKKAENTLTIIIIIEKSRK